MLTRVYPIILIAFLYSCKGYKMLDGYSKPVYVTLDTVTYSDSTIRFSDDEKLLLSYNDLESITGNFVKSIDLTRTGTFSPIISKPTFFYLKDYFLVYPGDKLMIRKLADNNYLFTIMDNEQRNNELIAFKKFYELEAIPDLMIDTSIVGNNLNHLIENKKSVIKQAQERAIKLIDSLNAAFQVSENVRNIYRQIVRDRYQSFYLRYLKNIIDSYGLYIKKDSLVYSTIPITAQILSSGIQIHSNIAIVNDLAEANIPVKIWQVKTVHDFEIDRRFILDFYTGVTKDYFLGQLYYSAFKKGIKIPEHIDIHKEFASDSKYLVLIKNTLAQKNKLEKKSDNKGDNVLLSINAKNIVSLERLIEQQKGKIIVIDFWASWCQPCLKEMPAYIDLTNHYANDQVSFLSISIENDIQSWRKKALSQPKGSFGNYLLLQYDRSSFVKEWEVSTIPRYIILDKKGMVIKKNAPWPSSGEFKKVLDSLLKNYN